MKIAFSHHIFSLQQYGGISRYFVQLIKHLNPYVSVTVLNVFHINNYLVHTHKIQKIMIHVSKLNPLFLRLIYLVNNFIQYLQIKIANKFDVLHLSYYSALKYKNKKTKVVLTVYDMIHEIYPESFPQKDQTAARKQNAINVADHVICISESTKKDLIKYYKTPEEKISVVYLGFEFDLGSISKNVYIQTRPKPYILFVGQRSGYKNFFGLLSAYAKSNYINENYDLICFGGGQLKSDEFDKISDLKLDKNRIAFLSGGDDVLMSLYSNASLFVYPSLYEGFGIPPLEAMSVGCPVVCSNTSSIPEVVGDAALLFNPHSDGDIANAIESVLQNDKLRNELITKGYERLKFFSWEKCAKEHFDVYRKVLEK
jgi:glycosyltransferase involved in cell wall biosynthesis